MGINPFVFNPATFLSDSAVTGKLLTGYSSGTGTITSSDSILTAINKLNGNIAAIVSGESGEVVSVNTVLPTAGNVTLTTANIADSSNKRYVTDAELSVLAVTSGTNTGDTSAINQVLTGYTSGAGTISATDSILQAIQKLNGNAAGGGAPTYIAGSGTATAGGGNSFAAGTSASSAGANSLALGNTASATNGQGIAIGYHASAIGNSSIAIGQSTVTSNATYEIAVGNGANVSGQGGIAIGGGTASAFNCVSLGYTATATSGSNGIAIGNSASTTGSGAIAIGSDGTNSATSGQAQAIMIGNHTAVNANDIIIGFDASAISYNGSTGLLSIPATSGVLIKTNTSLTNGAGAQVGTLTTAPSAGNPTKWIPINDNGTTRYIPAW